MSCRRFDQLLQTLRGDGLMPKEAVAHIGSSGALVQKWDMSAYDMIRVGRLIIDGTSVRNTHRD